jgi:hypothetical protein
MSKKKIPTKTRTSRRTPKAAARADYSQRFLERYGRSLSRRTFGCCKGTAAWRLRPNGYCSTLRPHWCVRGRRAVRMIYKFPTRLPTREMSPTDDAVRAEVGRLIDIGIVNLTVHGTTYHVTRGGGRVPPPA